ncbi:HAD-IA family hydrolase [Streptomyces sp. NPDC001435]|uniref:HAD-IA family hydrolase n=1 Tax=unclassified Streptomyces TaxID=2593676 RepID=UPI00369D4422
MTIHAQALLFDNDGTLVSSLDSVDRCWARWAREFGITAEDFARVEQLEVEDVPNGGVRLLPGTRDFLESLPAERWAVVTSATRRLAEARLDAVGIRPKMLVAADDVTRGKPDPEPYLLAARRLGVAPARCLVFEDAPAGIRAGRAAGMTTVALATTHPAQELVADLVVDDLSALSALVTDGVVEISVRR